MRKIVFLLTFALAAAPVFAQTKGTTTTSGKKKWKQVNVGSEVAAADTSKTAAPAGTSAVKPADREAAFAASISGAIKKETAKPQETDYTQTKEYKAVSKALRGFRSTVAFMTTKDVAKIAGPLESVVNQVFDNYAENPQDKSTFKAKDDKAFAAIKEKLNEKIVVGWQNQPIYLRKYITNFVNDYEMTSSEEEKMLKTFAAALTK